MRIAKIIAAAAVLSLAGAPALAEAGAAARTAQVDRASANAGGKSNLHGGQFVLAAIVLAAIIGAIVIAADKGNKNPTSA